jgi:2-oxoisovalerate dehydrogenase E1 component beta subunit
MIQQAIASPDPVLFFEPKGRYWEKAELDPSRGPDLALHAARIARHGTDVTIAAYGPTVRTALEAAEVVAPDGMSIEVVDLRSLSPLDTDTLAASVEKTRRLVVVHEAPTFLGLGAQVAAEISERCFFQLEAPVLRVGGYHAPYPPALLEDRYRPDLDRLLDAVDRVRSY